MVGENSLTSGRRIPTSEETRDAYHHDANHPRGICRMLAACLSAALSDFKACRVVGRFDGSFLPVLSRGYSPGQRPRVRGTRPDASVVRYPGVDRLPPVRGTS